MSCQRFSEDFFAKQDVEIGFEDTLIGLRDIRARKHFAVEFCSPLLQHADTDFILGCNCQVPRRGQREPQLCCEPHAEARCENAAQVVLRCDVDDAEPSGEIPQLQNSLAGLR